MNTIFTSFKITFLFILFSILIVGFNPLQAQDAKSPQGTYEFNELGLYRVGKKLTSAKSKEFRSPEKGFSWDKNDAETEVWRPQGITGVSKPGEEYLLVSWYGKDSYKNRGARISVVDISDMNSITYAHILLVEKKGTEYATFSGMHAGGIVALNGKLHVADSRGGYTKVRVFDLEKVISLKAGDEIKKYKYIMVEEYNYDAPFTPSYISYDNDRGEILIGKFVETPSKSKQNKFAWYIPPTNPSDAKTFDKNVTTYRLPNEIKKIQGMVASKVNGEQVLWVSTSYGKNNRSNFYKLIIPANPKTNGKTLSVSKTSLKYPPGLEDLFLGPNDLLWGLTEFAWKVGDYFPLDYQIEGAILGSHIIARETFGLNTRRGVFTIRK